MYINRGGLADNPGFKEIVKRMSFDIQSMFLVMAGDVQNVSNDILEELKETRMRLMIFSMKMNGLLPPFETASMRFSRMARLPALQRASLAVSSAMAVLLFFHK